MKPNDDNPRKFEWTGQNRKLLQQCWSCQTIGLKPGILATRLGDYGVREKYARYEELPLDDHGLCSRCAEVPPPELQSR